MNDLAERTLKLAEQLLGRASLTPDDAGCMELVADRLQGLGFRIEWITRNGVTNLWARRGTARPLICLAGHTDVVPTGPFSQWTSPPFEPTVREGFLFARGAADMKSSLAAFVTACEDFLDRFPEHPGSIAFLLTSDEEGDAIDGTRVVIDVLRARGETIDYCILGEPTAVRALGDTIKNGRRGSLHGRLRVKGLQGHIAYPHLAKNPIHLVAPAIAELAGMRWDEGNEFFPSTTWQISNIHAGTGADNVIPGTLEARFNFRFSTASTVHSLQQRLEAVLHAHGLEFTLEWTLGAAPFLTGEGELIDAAIEAIGDETGAQPELSTSGGTSDGRFIATICPQIVEIGPVNATSHKIDECVEVASLAKLSGIYRRIVERLLIGSVS